MVAFVPTMKPLDTPKSEKKPEEVGIIGGAKGTVEIEIKDCLLYTSPSPRD